MKFTHEPGSTPVGGFTIRRGIHRGGFGEVYYAVSDAGKEVALKLLQHEQEVELRGVTQCLNLKHPNLVNLFDIKTDAHGEQWVVMEYVNGTSLEDVLAAFPNGLPLDEVRDWLSGLVAGVTHLHDRGIVHRDLKPANVYRENGTVKIGDVGLSKKLGSDRRGAHTQSVGTVYYMAPEVAKGQYGPEVDVYSLGIMLYELLTGHVPFTGETTAEILMKQLTEKPNLATIPDNLRSVVAHVLEKDPAHRTSSVKQLEDEFRRAIEGVSLVETTPSTGPWRGWTGRRDDATVPQNGQSTGFASGTVGVSQVESSRPVEPAKPPPIPERSRERPSRSERVTPVSHKPRPARTSSTSESDRQNLIVMAIVVCGLLLLFSPGTQRAWLGLGLVGVAIAASQFARSRRWTNSGSAPTPLQQALADSSSQRHRVSSLSSSLPLGSLLSRDALRETSSSLALASLCACLLSVGLSFAGDFLNRTPALPTTEMTALFMATTMAGAWILLLANQCTRRTSWGDRHPRLVNLFAGIIVGSIAFGLDEFLRVDFPRTGLPDSAFRSLGVHPLTVDRFNPTWLGYVVFFGGLFFIRRWWIDMDAHRPKSFSLGRLFLAGLAAFLVTVFFEFPARPAMLWAVTLSATVQLAAPWSSSPRRESFWRS